MRRARETSFDPGQDRLPDGNIQAIRSLLPYLWPRNAPDLRARVVIAVVFLILAKIATVYVPILYKYAVDALGGDGQPRGTESGDVATDALGLMAIPVGIILAYGLVRVLSLAFGELRDAVFARVAQRTIRTVGLQVFRHLHRLSLRFHLERQTGGLSRAIDRGTKAIESVLQVTLFNVIPTLFEILLVTVILWAMFDIWFALATLATVTGYIVWTFAVTEWRIKFRRQMNESDSRANTRAIDSLLNYETVKYFGNEAHEARRLDSALEAYENAAVTSRTSLSMLNIGQGVIISIGLSGIMYMAARGIVEGELTIGDFVLVNTYLLQLYQPLNFFGVVYRQIKQSLIDMENMFALLHRDEEVKDKPDARPLTIHEGRVTFRDVRFGYDERRPILDGVSFEIQPGQTVAVVGPTGAGKSTLSRLLFRFYDVWDGGIAIDGQDLRDVTQESLRATMGIVPQDTVLFNESIYYNIAYGRPSASEDEVRAAARMARIHRFIESLPDGYETIVGERGLKLSGGEKQRVAIARAILKEPAILVFDEATSALDTQTEQAIQANLREVSAGRTTLTVAHRLSTVVDADQILVMQDGRIMERGDHHMLVRQGGLYATMWARQQSASEGDPSAEAVACVSGLGSTAADR